MPAESASEVLEPTEDELHEMLVNALQWLASERKTVERLERELADAKRRGPVTEMNVCEIAHLILHAGVLYRFRKAPGCAACEAY